MNGAFSDSLREWCGLNGGDPSSASVSRLQPVESIRADPAGAAVPSRWPGIVDLPEDVSAYMPFVGAPLSDGRVGVRPGVIAA